VTAGDDVGAVVVVDVVDAGVVTLGAWVVVSDAVVEVLALVASAVGSPPLHAVRETAVVIAMTSPALSPVTPTHPRIPPIDLSQVIECWRQPQAIR
jgi:uncharacterized protein YggT (Ycf19 family)